MYIYIYIQHIIHPTTQAKLSLCHFGSRSWVMSELGSRKTRAWMPPQPKSTGARSHTPQRRDDQRTRKRNRTAAETKAPQALGVSYGDNDRGEAAIDSDSGSAPANNNDPATTAAEESKAAQQAAVLHFTIVAQTLASAALDNALTISGRTGVVSAVTAAWSTIGRDVELAKQRVVQRDSSPTLAASALAAISQALASCPPGELNAALVIAERLTRDYLIWRTTIRCPLDDRNGFLAVLLGAVGPCTRDQQSHLLHSHAHEVCIYIYIYVYIQRESDISIYIYIYMYIYIYL
jgi:hypothetical protein